MLIHKILSKVAIQRSPKPKSRAYNRWCFLITTRFGCPFLEAMPHASGAVGTPLARSRDHKPQRSCSGHNASADFMPQLVTSHYASAYSPEVVEHRENVSVGSDYAPSLGQIQYTCALHVLPSSCPKRRTSAIRRSHSP